MDYIVILRYTFSDGLYCHIAIYVYRWIILSYCDIRLSMDYIVILRYTFSDGLYCHIAIYVYRWIILSYCDIRLSMDYIVILRYTFIDGFADTLKEGRGIHFMGIVTTKKKPFLLPEVYLNKKSLQCYPCAHPRINNITPPPYHFDQV